MSDRTFGVTKNCAGCRYWSEMIAGCYGAAPVQAMCLAPSERRVYTSANNRCDSWKRGDLGAIDTPGFTGREYEDFDASDITAAPRSIGAAADDALYLGQLQPWIDAACEAEESIPEWELEIAAASMEFLDAMGRDG